MNRSPDFPAAAAVFAGHGWQADQLAASIWRYRPSHRRPHTRLLLSAGVHGDETAPVEMLARCLPRWAAWAPSLNVELVLALGNMEALAAGRRFVRHDMNRLFGSGPRPAAWGSEGERAALLQHCTGLLLQDESGTARSLHLDLHTTIRPSLKPAFAIVPGDADAAPLLHWLGRAGLDAAVLNPGPNVTFSAFTAQRGALACTVELGQVGTGDAGQLARFEAALDALLREPEAAWQPAGEPGLPVYRVTRELIRRSEHFELMVPGTAPNFAALAPGQLVARDRLDLVHARQAGECVLFPNPGVALGLRACLLVAPVAAGADAPGTVATSPAN